MANAAFEFIDPEDVHVERINDQVSAMENYTDHEHVFKITNDKIGAALFVGVHDTTLGPSLGGFRFAPYESEEEAITDVLRLSRGMSYKNSIARLDIGGGKAVGLAPKGQRNPDAAFLETAAVGFERINTEYQTKFGERGLYITAEDVGTTVDGMKKVAGHTEWVVGAKGEAPDPSPQTARGVVTAIRICARRQYGSSDLSGRSISVQGVGNVGMDVVRILCEHEGVETIYVSDLDTRALSRAKTLYGAHIVSPDEIFTSKADIFVPCAMGGVLTEENIDRLYEAGVRIVCGGANNQEPDEKDHTQSKYMQEKGILYAPDFVANLGGVTWVAKEPEIVSDPGSAPGIKRGIVRAVIRSLNRVFDMAEEEGIDTATAAGRVAVLRIEKAAAEKSGTKKSAQSA